MKVKGYKVAAELEGLTLTATADGKMGRAALGTDERVIDLGHVEAISFARGNMLKNGSLVLVDARGKTDLHFRRKDNGAWEALYDAVARLVPPEALHASTKHTALVNEDRDVWHDKQLDEIGRGKAERPAAADAQHALTDARTTFLTADPAEALALAKDIASNESLAVLPDKERAALTDQALSAYADNVLADDILTPDEEKHFFTVLEALGYTVESVMSSHPDLASRIVVATVNDGRLAEIPNPDVIRKRGEVVHLEVQAQLLKEVALREFQGGSQGVSIPIAKGVRYRVGAFRGRTVTVGSEMTVQDTGMLSVTSQRVAYLGSAKSSEILYTKLMGIEAFSDGIRLHASNRQNALLFRFARGISGDAVAATLNAAVQRSLA